MTNKVLEQLYTVKFSGLMMETGVKKKIEQDAKALSDCWSETQKSERKVSRCRLAHFLV